ncbi:DUF7350 domain-containing protein [Natronorubrum daqingense]|uniref:DUF7350 domain-containing protein n=2 Tax=Natronorubrum daqingense TaxID=588898 RepID=A0A1P8RBB2_9EURY|nr:hypothetical protein [Natronorubrum daqingense]APX95980.1 hypothetical protein BB347_04740 [Natronorubrum daqingense]
MHDRAMNRRTFARLTGVGAGTLALAGCLDGIADGDGDDEGDDSSDGENGGGSDEDVDVPAFPEIDDPPDAVYRPTHRESMRVLEPVDAGEYTLAPMLSYPHPFWVVAGGADEDEVEREDPEQMEGVHLMVLCWDEETETILPVDEGVEIAVSRDGDPVGSPRSAWTMISQEMGFHFGDNVPLEGDGTYTVDVELPSLSVRRTGDLEDRFTDRERATFEFDYDQSFRDAVFDVTYFDEDEWGEPGALEPMHGEDAGEHDEHHDDGHADDDHGGHEDGDHEDDDHHGHHEDIPYSSLPPASDYPGTLLESTEEPEDGDLPRSGDAAFVATLVDSSSRLAVDGETTLLVSPRTPYNRVPLADMSIRAILEREDESVADADLEQTIDGEYGLHYAGPLPDAAAGDGVTVEVDAPPQVARHQGYETAFLEMPPIEFDVPEVR